MKNFFFILSVISLLSCNNNQEEIFKTELDSLLKDLNIITEVSVNIKKQDINISFYIQNPRFLDYNSYKVFSSFIVVEFYEKIKKYDNVNLHYKLKGFENEKFSTNQTKEMVTYYYINSNPMFHKLLHYTFKNYSYEDLIRSDFVINELHNHFNEFTFNNDFWVFLLKYSENYKDINNQYTIQFLFFCKTGLDKSSHINPKHLIFFVKSGGYNPEDFGMSPKEEF